MTVQDAATVVLVRDAASGLQVYLQCRAATMAFAAGMWAFPGGRVDPLDYRTGIPDAAGWEQVLHAEARTCSALLAAAVRETAEEAGVALDPSALKAWSHWITPESEPRRYDTRFFVAALPDGNEPRIVGNEAQKHAWVRPGAAGDLPMLPPTRITLDELAAFESVAAVLAAPRAIEPITPRRDGDTVVLPGGVRYPLP